LPYSTADNFSVADIYIGPNEPMLIEFTGPMALVKLDSYLVLRRNVYTDAANLLRQEPFEHSFQEGIGNALATVFLCRVKPLKFALALVAGGSVSGYVSGEFSVDFGYENGSRFKGKTRRISALDITLYPLLD
jgi:hypothetical protein